MTTRRKRLFKVKTLYTLLAAAGAGALAFALMQFWESAATPLQSDTAKQADDRIDYYLKQPHTTQYNKEGSLQYTLSADQLEHFEISDRGDLQQPRFTTHRNQQIEWRGHSQQGIVEKGGDKVTLNNQVELKRTTPTEATITTESVTLFPQREQAKTALDVTLIEPGSRTTGTGMRADFKSGRIQLLDNVRGHYETP